jgi:hypothetical protein
MCIIQFSTSGKRKEQIKRGRKGGRKQKEGKLFLLPTVVHPDF